eukprot:TRINITY_DN3542_c0_g1_i1.p2 TRINITY_DN3542_c0_g1~~TRINITY_DN3542_c0_g1_i1.p2  ORF type:complete len:377 (-),score=120.32 TRINITY_DN3542_c0_g1_i1:8-1138(-)
MRRRSRADVVVVVVRDDRSRSASDWVLAALVAFTAGAATGYAPAVLLHVRALAALGFGVAVARPWEPLAGVAAALPLLWLLRRLVCDLAIAPFANAVLLPKWQRDGDLAASGGAAPKVERLRTVGFKLVYFTFVTVAGWLLFRRQLWFPLLLGGPRDAEPELLYLGYPFCCHAEAGQANVAVVWAMKLFYMVQLGYHADSLVRHLLWERARRDFWEMLLHHLVACALVLFSYLSNFLRVGILVFLVHDACDVFICALKIIVEVGGHNVAMVVCYVLLMCTWVYCRLFAFPLLVIAPSVLVPLRVLGPRSIGPLLFFNSLLLVLLALHVYWCCLLLRMGGGYLGRGIIKDEQQQVAYANAACKQRQCPSPSPGTQQQ